MNGTGYWITLAAGLILAGLLFVFRLREAGEDRKRAACFAPAAMAAGAVIAWLLAKAVFLLLNGWDLLSGEGIGAFFRLSPDEFSFVGGAVGMCLGIAAVAKTAEKRQWIRNRTAAVMDAFAVPGCLLIIFLRMAELFLEQQGLGEMATVGLPEIEEGSLLAFAPLSMPDGWGGRLLSVCTLEALAALIIGITCLLPRNRSLPEGLCFQQAAYRLCCIQIFLQLLRIVSSVFYFVHVDQALCGVVLLGILIAVCRKIRKQGKKIPVSAPVLLIGGMVINGVTQFFMDKYWMLEDLLPVHVFEWINDNLAPLGFAIMLLTVLGMLLSWQILRKRLLAPCKPRI